MKLGKNSTIELESSDSKNGNEATIRLNPELADELGQWILDRKLGLSSKLFDMPSKGMKRFTYDANGAGIEMLDSRGRSVDVHALRHTFGSMLVRSGVNAKVCQEAMRHSNISLTMDIYAHNNDGVVQAAVEALPSLGVTSVMPASPIDPASTPSSLSPEETMLLAMYRKTDPAKRILAIAQLI